MLWSFGPCGAPTLVNLFVWEGLERNEESVTMSPFLLGKQNRIFYCREEGKAACLRLTSGLVGGGSSEDWAMMAFSRT